MEQIMTIEEVSKYLKLHPETIYKKTREGEIPGKRIGRERRFLKSVIDMWLGSDLTFTRESFDTLKEETRRIFVKEGVTEQDAEFIVTETRKGKRLGAKKR